MKEQTKMKSGHTECFAVGVTNYCAIIATARWGANRGF